MIIAAASFKIDSVKQRLAGLDESREAQENEAIETAARRRKARRTGTAWGGHRGTQPRAVD